MSADCAKTGVASIKKERTNEYKTMSFFISYPKYKYIRAANGCYYSEYIEIETNVNRSTSSHHFQKVLHDGRIIKLSMKTKTGAKKVLIICSALVIGVLLLTGVFTRFVDSTKNFPTKPSEESFKAPGKDWESSKKVEDYFVERLHMTAEEAGKVRSPGNGNDEKITLRLTQGTTLSALMSNLEYYGFVRDEKALEYALLHSVDKLPGRADALKIGSNTVDIYSSYRISEDMDAWEIADQLLNHPTYFAFDEYRYMFMP